MQVESLRVLQESLSWIDDLIRAAVARAQSAGLDPTDALRGLVITDDEVVNHLSTPALSGLWDGERLFNAVESMPLANENPIANLARLFHLTALDCHILLVCLAPEVDRRYDRLYAYLQDDVSQRRPSVNLMVNLLGGDVVERFTVWERLQPDRPLRANHLLEAVPDPGQVNPTFLAHHLKLDHRIVLYLLGDSTVDLRLKHTTTLQSPSELKKRIVDVPETLRYALESALQGSPPIVHLQGANGSGRKSAIETVCAQFEMPLVTADLALLKDLDISVQLAWELALREAILNNAALLLYNWDACLSQSDLQPPADLWKAVEHFPQVVFLCGAESFEPLDPGRARKMLRIKFSLPSYEIRFESWREALDASHVTLDEARLDELASKFKLTGSQISLAVHTAADIAASRGNAVTIEDLISGAQAHSSLQLGRLAKRIVPRFNWGDLILPPDRIEVLREICARIRYGHIVNDSWGFSHRVAAAPGVTALFAGESGTGKTLAAEVIAHDLGLLLYKIDLSAVVSKYIGETEKNLSVIFDEAHQSNAVLFFDEADALFGKRSEVKDAHDRYANLEVAYLLQQLEVYEGVAILATNLRQNLDEAFTRRLSFLVDFPFPEREYREKLWVSHFPSEAPLGVDVDLHELSDRFSLAGGNIRNAAIASAYLAAADGGRITMSHLRHAIKREHQKMGRLLDDDY